MGRSTVQNCQDNGKQSSVLGYGHVLRHTRIETLPNNISERIRESFQKTVLVRAFILSRAFRIIFVVSLPFSVSRYSLLL